MTDLYTTDFWSGKFSANKVFMQKTRQTIKLTQYVGQCLGLLPANASQPGCIELTQFPFSQHILPLIAC